MNKQPVGDRILAQKVEVKQVGSILLPAESQAQTVEAKVIAVGPDVKNCAEGEHVIFGKYAGMEYQTGNEKYLWLRDEDIMGRGPATV